MASRRCLHALTRQYVSILSSNSSLQSIKTINPHLQQQYVTQVISVETLPSKLYRISTDCSHSQLPVFSRNFCSNQRNESADDESEEESDDDEVVSASNSVLMREYSLEEKEKEAADIGYKVIGPLQKSERVFKPYEPVFAVVQIGSHQFKVSNGDCIYTERLKFCEVNDKLILNRVLMLGSTTQTIIGRPILRDAAVHAVVEEHALDAKVIIFKKKRRKNYRRKKGHRQELTKLRITDIQGIEKPEITTPEKQVKADLKVENVPVAA